MDDSTKKVIILEERPKNIKKVKIEKPKKKRIITATINWESAVKELEDTDVDAILNHPDDNNTCKIILQQIKKKISGYLVQDRGKNRVNKELFVDVQDVIKEENLEFADAKFFLVLCAAFINFLQERVS